MATPKISSKVDHRLRGAVMNRTTKRVHARIDRRRYHQEVKYYGQLTTMVSYILRSLQRAVRETHEALREGVYREDWHTDHEEE